MTAFSYFKLPDPLIPDKCHPDTGIIVCIPAYNEQYIKRTIHSLCQCAMPPCMVEILVLVNEPDDVNILTQSINKQCFEELLNFPMERKPRWISLFPLRVTDIPLKIFGVGLARSLLMNEANKRLQSSESRCKIIASFDADSLCDSNYYNALYTHFEAENAPEAASIYFEHPLNDDLPEANLNAIVQYELHLRYYIHIQRRIGLPFAFYTLGSSMAINAESYIKIGGMNTRKAGEDFYFLHKYVQINQCAELNTTRILASGRMSDRVPFGTGKAVQKLIQSTGIQYTYHPDSFVRLDELTGFLSRCYEMTSLKEISSFIQKLNAPVREYLTTINAKRRISEIKANTASFASFQNRFFQWFNAFRLMKYLHFTRDRYYPDIPVIEAVNWLYPEENESDKNSTAVQWLLKMRGIDKGRRTVWP